MRNLRSIMKKDAVAAVDSNNDATALQLDTSPGRKVGLVERLGVFLPLAAWVLLLIVFSILSDKFFTATNWLNIIRQSGVLMVVALAGTWVIMMGMIDLSVGAVLTLGTIITAMSVKAWGPVGVLFALAICLCCGAVAGSLNAYLKLPSFLATLGLLFVWQGAGYLISGGRPRPFEDDVVMNVMGSTLGGIPIIGIWAIIAFLVCVFAARRMRFGRYVLAIGDSERVARMSGVPVDRMKIVAFAVSGFLAGLAGALMAVRASSGSVGMGEPFLLDSIAAIVLGGTALSGGVGGPQRTIFGVLVIITLSNGMVITGVDPFWQIVIRGIVVIGAVAISTAGGATKGQIVK